MTGEVLGPAMGAAAALGAGLLSFLSPCVLPLVPVYLSYLSGYGLADIREGKQRLRVLARSLAFSLGFTLVFVALGLVFAGGMGLAGASAVFLRIASGSVVALLGLNLVFDVVKFLDIERRFHPGRPARSRLGGFAGALLLGVAFAAGWSPCIGPILASILLLASREGNLARAGFLLFGYSLGLALPFIAAGLAFDRLKPVLDWAKRRGRAIRVAAGLLMTVLGILMASGRLGRVSGLAARAGFALKGALDASPSAVRAVDLGIEILLAASIPALPAIRKRPSLTAPRLVTAALIAAFALCELIGLCSLSGIVAGWLGFQGV
jgi:cytochrome c-type biogenesis protein